MNLVGIANVTVLPASVLLVSLVISGVLAGEELVELERVSEEALTFLRSAEGRRGGTECCGARGARRRRQL